MSAKKLSLGEFIHWDKGENYPFSACMSKLMACLGGDESLYTYNFFAGLSGDDFVMCYGDNGKFNDCLSVCCEPETFFRRTFGQIGLAYEYLPSEIWTKNINQTWEKICRLIDKGIPVLMKGEGVGGDRNYRLLLGYDQEGPVIFACGGDMSSEEAFPLTQTPFSLIFIEQLPAIEDLAAAYRAAILALPGLMEQKPCGGVWFGAAAYQKWADDLENGRYDRCSHENFDGWRDWDIYLCNLATNAGHGWDFIARAYVHNPDMLKILQLIPLLERNNGVWNRLEELGFGFGIQLDRLQDAEKRPEAVRLIRSLAKASEEMVSLFK